MTDRDDLTPDELEEARKEAIRRKIEETREYLAELRALAANPLERDA